MDQLFCSAFKRRSCFTNCAYYFQRRYKKKLHWSEIGKKTLPTGAALKHFDDFYKNVYSERWPSMRVALLSPHKYCAVVNNFSDTEDICNDLQIRGALNIKSLFNIERKKIEAEKNEKWKINHMEKVNSLDKKLERMYMEKQQEELQSIYPEPDDVNISTENEEPKQEHLSDKGSETSAAHKYSLKKGLQEAEIDEHRIIDPTLGLTASALYEFVPTTELKGMEDYVLESEHYRYYQNDSSFPVEIEHEYVLKFSEHLRVFTYEMGNITSFPEPKRGSTGVSNYYCLDGSSLLPVLALNIQPGDKVLDMCAAPGGKSLMIFQTLSSGVLVCNDITESRVKRLYSVFEEFLYDIENWEDQLQITKNDGRNIDETDFFDKILVDVPCTTDRHSLLEDDNNIFKSTRIKERLKLPEIQSALLSNALKLVRPGGTVVYSTCSLSPIQNDGVVHMALRHVWEETKMEFCVRNMSPALEEVESVFKLEKTVNMKYGHLVIPYLPANFGPMYFCKIVRHK